MDATTMRSIADQLAAIMADHAELSFIEADEFHWSPQTQLIAYTPADAHACERLLHEIAHARLGHSHYHHDIQLIQMERAAWEYARQLSSRYSLEISDDLIEDDLDTYRDWLHARSTCPLCSLNGLQTAPGEYMCSYCHQVWRVNGALRCGLRRYQTK